MEMLVRKEVAAATIVEYSDQMQAANRYPDRIVSPSAPSRCCVVEMEQVGAEQHEGEWIFVYMRCRGCGYTVRRFTYTIEPSPSSLWDLLEPASDAPRNHEYRRQSRLRWLCPAEDDELL